MISEADLKKWLDEAAQLVPVGVGDYIAAHRLRKDIADNNTLAVGLAAMLARNAEELSTLQKLFGAEPEGSAQYVLPTASLPVGLFGAVNDSAERRKRRWRVAALTAILLLVVFVAFLFIASQISSRMGDLVPTGRSAGGASR
jgi:type II secretory pathway component PulL